MANWCSNYIHFEADDSTMAEIRQFFEAMMAKETSAKRGQLPCFGEFDGGYLFDMRWELDSLYYETQWEPNTDVIIAVADHFLSDFVHVYVEPLRNIYGRAIYRNRTLKIVDLYNEYGDKISCNEQNDDGVFEGKPYPSSDAIIAILLEHQQ